MQYPGLCVVAGGLHNERVFQLFFIYPTVIFTILRATKAVMLIVHFHFKFSIGPTFLLAYLRKPNDTQNVFRYLTSFAELVSNSAPAFEEYCC